MGTASGRSASAGRGLFLPRRIRPRCRPRGPAPGAERSDPMAKKIVIYTTTWCPDCRAAKKFLASKNLSYEEIDIEKNPDAAAIVMKLSDGMRKVPTLDIEGTIGSGDKYEPSRDWKD